MMDLSMSSQSAPTLVPRAAETARAGIFVPRIAFISGSGHGATSVMLHTISMGMSLPPLATAAVRQRVAYARMLIEGHKMNVIYFDPFQKDEFEKYVSGYADFLESHGEARVTCTRASSVDELLAASDVVSLHCLLNEETKHMIDAAALGRMKPNAVLVNAARGPVINEADLVAHLRANPDFRCGLDVFEDEPLMAPGLAECPNAVIVPHIASASMWTRSAMATMAAANVAERLAGNPVNSDMGTVVERYVDSEFDAVPRMSPSIVNAKELGL